MASSSSIKNKNHGYVDAAESKQQQETGQLLVATGNMAPLATNKWSQNYTDVLTLAESSGQIKFDRKNRDMRRLNAWMKYQLKRYKSGSMPEYQKKKMDFLYSTYKYDQTPQKEKNREAWNKMFEKLVAHYEKHGTFTVNPQEDKALYNWIFSQRDKANNNRLPDDQRTKLLNIGFIFKWYQRRTEERRMSVQQVKQWECMYEQLVEFWKIHQHCRVPTIYETNPALGQWVSQQRKVFKHGKMIKQREERLNALGFAWNLALGRPGSVTNASTQT